MRWTTTSLETGSSYLPSKYSLMHTLSQLLFLIINPYFLLSLLGPPPPPGSPLRVERHHNAPGTPPLVPQQDGEFVSPDRRGEPDEPDEDDDSSSSSSSPPRLHRRFPLPLGANRLKPRTRKRKRKWYCTTSVYQSLSKSQLRRDPIFAQLRKCKGQWDEVFSLAYERMSLDRSQQLKQERHIENLKKKLKASQDDATKLRRRIKLSEGRDSNLVPMTDKKNRLKKLKNLKKVLAYEPVEKVDPMSMNVTVEPARIIEVGELEDMRRQRDRLLGMLEGFEIFECPMEKLDRAFYKSAALQQTATDILVIVANVMKQSLAPKGMSLTDRRELEECSPGRSPVVVKTYFFLIHEGKQRI